MIVPTIKAISAPTQIKYVRQWRVPTQPANESPAVSSEVCLIYSNGGRNILGADWQ